MAMNVFLSSTYVDLTEHRRAATDAIERLGHTVGRMEIFGARPEEATVASLGEIDRCDVLLGLYAHRYGYVPEGSVTSITEAEFDHAHARSKPVLCFVVDGTHPWPPALIEDEPGKSRLTAFKNRIARAVVTDTFTTPENLAYKVGTSAGRYYTRQAAPAVAPDAIPPLRPPIAKVPTSAQPSTSPLQIRLALAGLPPDAASCVFDITVSNASAEQIILTEFDVRWRYWNGNLYGGGRGATLTPIAAYLISLAIDTDTGAEQHGAEVLYPPLALPPVNESGPSLTTLRLQLHYHHVGRIDWHPTADWNLVFSVAIRDDRDRLLPVFSDLSWRTLPELEPEPWKDPVTGGAPPNADDFWAEMKRRAGGELNLSAPSESRDHPDVG
jgi:hypothetical protein